MKTFLKSILIAFIYFGCLIICLGVLFLLFTALFQRWDLWEALVTTKNGRLVFFILSVTAGCIGIYMASVYIQYHKIKKKGY